ncbi:MAG: hypothetical protein RO469_15055 [Thermincola sp.]|nr:hypothetical protein [Thermincola sp.]MDT3702059.1 hypothetical protein [Thermincola sp.]
MGNYQVNNSYKWVVLVISFFMMMGFALSLQVLPPLFDQITRDVSAPQAGFLSSLIMLVPIFVTPIIGVIFDKTGRKNPFCF